MKKVILICFFIVIGCKETSNPSLSEDKATYNIHNAIREVIRFERMSGDAPVRFVGRDTYFVLEETLGNNYFLQPRGMEIDTLIWEGEFEFTTEYLQSGYEALYRYGWLEMQYLSSTPDTGKFFVSLIKYEYAYDQQTGVRKPTSELNEIYTQTDTFEYPYFIRFFSSYPYNLNSVTNY